MIDMRGRKTKELRIGPQMLEATKIVYYRHNGLAPSRISVYSQLRTRKYRWSNLYMSAVLDRAITAGLLKELPRTKGGKIPVEITDLGRQKILERKKTVK
jgi:hypothetical protein